jgi:hypothetical protein
MALTFSTQAQVAFKNLLGKSQTTTSKDIVGESEGISFNVTSDNIWTDTIYTNDPTTTLGQGTTVQVLANLTLDTTSNGHAYFATWPTSPPTGTDIKTGSTFSYGVGSLIGVMGGDRVRGSISDGYGNLYQARPFITYSSSEIYTSDSRTWFFQYNSGVFYQDITTGIAPTKILLWVYIGQKLSSPIATTQQNIRITATGTNGYYATYSEPTIATYSSSYLFLVDFVNTNTSGTVSLNISNIGTVSVVKYGQNGPITLQSSEITGATGGTAGPIYYLTYNHGVFQFFDSNPVQSSIGYTNLAPTINNVGGLERGTSFNDVLLQNVFNDLLYPEQLGNITDFKLVDSSGTEVTKFEVGDNMSPDSYTFSWSLVNTGFESNSVKLQDITNVSSTETYWSAPSGYIATGLTNSSIYNWILSATISSSIARSRDFRVYINRDNATTISKSLSVNWMLPVYTGSTSSTSLSGLQILSNLTNKTLATNSNILLTIPGSGYKYIAAPETFNPIYSLTLDKIEVVMAATADGYINNYSNSLYYDKVWVTSSYGIGATYNVYRTLNSISESIDLVPSDSIKITDPIYNGLVGATGPIGATGLTGNVTDIGITYSYSTSYNLTSANINNVLAMSHSNSAIVYIQPYSISPINNGSQIMLVNWSGITMSVSATGSVTLLSADTAKRLRTKYSAATLIQMSQDVWLLSGDITI